MMTYDPQQNRDYRKAELNPEVYLLFKKARDERSKIVVRSMVDVNGKPSVHGSHF